MVVIVIRVLLVFMLIAATPFGLTLIAAAFLCTQFFANLNLGISSVLRTGYFMSPTRLLVLRNPV
jgi:hypothetical protein